MFGLPDHIDDAAAQSARAVSNWAARAVAAARTRARALGARIAHDAEIVWRDMVSLANWLGFHRDRAFILVNARVAPLRAAMREDARWIAAAFAPTIAKARADLRWLRSVLAPVSLCVAIGGGVATVAAPGMLILAGAYSIAMRPAAVAPVLVQPAEPALPDYVTFIDRFHGVDDQRWIVSDGWDNGEWVDNDWRRSALHPGRNGMRILMTPNEPGADKPYAAGELQSREMYRYGYYEIRMRIPRGAGTGVGFFTYSEPEGRPSWQEIDIELIGRNTRSIELNYHLGGRTRGQRMGLPFDAADGYHTYAFEWTPEGVRWYVDNRLAYALTDTGARRLTNPQRLYLSLWASKIKVWVGDLDTSHMPWALDVACVAQAREYRGVSLCAPAAETTQAQARPSR